MMKREIMTYQIGAARAKTLRRVFSDCGYKVFHAASSTQLILHLLDSPIEGVVAEVESMDEYERVAAAVRRLRPHASLVILSETPGIGVTDAELQACPEVVVAALEMEIMRAAAA
jgi:hypothetical protein